MTETDWLSCNGIDINGLNRCDRDRIQKMGFDAWLDEVATESTNPVTKTYGRMHVVSGNATKGRITRVPCKCVVCDKDFFAKRTDAVYCNDRCKMKGSRRGLLHRAKGRLPLAPASDGNVTINGQQSLSDQQVADASGLPW